MNDVFNKWFDEDLCAEGNYDLQPDEAGAKGWYACKSAVLKILNDNLITNNDGTSFMIAIQTIKQIEEQL